MKIIDDKVGKYFWFEYHCFESIASCDAKLWYRSHEKVFVLSISEFGYGDTPIERGENGEPRVYKVIFEDGFEYAVFEDELMNSPDEFYRPDPPNKRKLQEQISRIKSMMNINENYIGSCVDVGSEYRINIINDIFSDATEMAYYVGDPDNDDWGLSVEIPKNEFFGVFDKKFVDKKQLKNDVSFFYIPNLNLYYIYNFDDGIHYFYKNNEKL